MPLFVHAKRMENFGVFVNAFFLQNLQIGKSCAAEPGRARMPPTRRPTSGRALAGTVSDSAQLLLKPVAPMLTSVMKILCNTSVNGNGETY